MTQPLSINLSKIRTKISQKIAFIQRDIRERLVSREITMPSRLEQQRQNLGQNGLLFPSDQQYSGILKLRIYGGGLKDKLYVYLSTAIAYCIEQNLYLDWDGDLEGYGNWSDWFEPFIGEFPEDPLPSVNLVPDWYEMSPLFIHILNRYPPTFIRNIWKLNETTLNLLTRLQIDQVPSPFAAIQVRRGDKLRWSQIQLISAETILSAVPNHIENLFVATDDYSVIEELQNLWSKSLHTLCTPGHRGSDIENSHFLSGTNEEKRLEVLRLITDINTCVKSDLFLRVLPFKKLNSCGHGRNYQISDMISDLRRHDNEIVLH